MAYVMASAPSEAVVTGSVTVTPSQAGAEWVLTGPLGYDSGTQTGTVQVDDLDFGEYTATFADNLFGFSPPAPDVDTLSGPTLDLTGTYAARSTFGPTVSVEEDGGAPGANFGDWSITNDEGFTFAASGDSDTNNHPTPVSPSSGDFYTGRNYTLTFSAETGYTTPSPLAIAAAGEYTGDYITLAGQIVWQSSEQTSDYMDHPGTQNPIGNVVAPDDANGVNLGRVLSSTHGGGAGYSTRWYGDFGSARAQFGLWFTDQPSDYMTLATSGDPMFTSWEMWVPSAVTLAGNYPWISIFDHHVNSTPAGANRWHTHPAIMWMPNYKGAGGSNRVHITWAQFPSPGNPDSPEVLLPTGEWFSMELQWQFLLSGATVRLFVNGTQEVVQNNLITRNSSQNSVETYFKQYGEEGGGTITPNPLIMYRRNLKIADVKQT